MAVRTLGAVKQRVRSLLGDPDGDWLTDDFITPLINQVYEQYCSSLSDTGATLTRKVVVLPGIPLGTSAIIGDLAEPLDSMVDDPINVDWKQAGAPNDMWRPVREAERIPDINPGQNSTPYYEYRAYVLYLTPFLFAIDLRVRADFDPPELVEDKDLILVHPRLGHVLAYGSAALAAAERPTLAWAQTYGAEATTTLNVIRQQLSRGRQGVTLKPARIRPGRTRRR